jgi:hypothetical protein
MKKLILIALLALAGCATRPTTNSVMPDWPAAPSDLQAPAEELEPLDEKQNKLSDLLENSTNNYAKYYVLKQKYEAWQQWYTTQQQIWNGLKK